MKKQTGSILLVASTCIGSGMIALPMILAKLGLIPSMVLMFGVWGLTYFTSLINLELNLQAGKGLSLGDLAQHFSGPTIKIIGNISLLLLSYALLAVFLYGGASVIQNLLNHSLSLKMITIVYTSICFLTLLLPMTLIDYINRILFTGLIGIIALLVAGLFFLIEWKNLPLFSPNWQSGITWRSVIPIVFTSFGFQVIFHTLTNYCNNNAGMLRKAFFWGSLIPAFVYSIWTCSVLGVVHNKNISFYQQMVLGKIDIGDLVKELSHIAHWPLMQTLIGWISLLAIVTSVLGIGIGLCDTIKNKLTGHRISSFGRTLIAAFTTIFPAYIVAVLVPNAFISVLGFAGMILVVIAIIIPVYLFYPLKIPQLHYGILKNNFYIWVSAMAGVLIISCELTNILNP